MSKKKQEKILYIFSIYLLVKIYIFVILYIGTNKKENVLLFWVKMNNRCICRCDSI